MSYAFVCTKHCVGLDMADAVYERGLIAAISPNESLSEDPQDVDFDGVVLPNGNVLRTFDFDLSEMACSEFEKILNTPAKDIAAYEKRQEAEECQEFWCVTDLEMGWEDGGGIPEDMNMHENWIKMNQGGDDD
jgi:hypothetical protein